MIDAYTDMMARLSAIFAEEQHVLVAVNDPHALPEHPNGVGTTTVRAGVGARVRVTVTVRARARRCHHHGDRQTTGPGVRAMRQCSLPQEKRGSWGDSRLVIV